eukprot:m.69093 g.69093  ORF g.69093 m.69093 type:complete len:180 (-) comp12212_c0_seq5:1178-1717(-)
MTTREAPDPSLQHDGAEGGSSSTGLGTNSQPLDTHDGYQPKTILVTGGAGFIGSHVCEHLHGTLVHSRIIVADKLDACSSRKNLASLQESERFTFVKGDITHTKWLIDLLQSNQIDTVLHFAAATHVDNSIHKASTTFVHDNILATHSLLEACRVGFLVAFLFTVIKGSFAAIYVHPFW